MATRKRSASKRTAAKGTAAKRTAAKRTASKRTASKPTASKRAQAASGSTGATAARTIRPAAGRATKSSPAKRGATGKAKRKPKRDTCFVISPFGGWHDDYHRDIFCSAIQAAGLEPARADDLFMSSNIVHDIWHMINKSRVLLADMTGKNPNVFYELGLAHAARKPVLLVTQSIDDVPFDLRSLRVIPYDVEHPSWAQLLRDGITQGLRETLQAPQTSVLPTFLVERPDSTPRVSAEEKRLLDMQQQIESLRSELRSELRDKPGHPRRDIRAPEARRLIRAYLNQGMPQSLIVRRVSDLGAPRDWVERQIDELAQTSRTLEES